MRRQSLPQAVILLLTFPSTWRTCRKHQRWQELARLFEGEQYWSDANSLTSVSCSIQSKKLQMEMSKSAKCGLILLRKNQKMKNNKTGDYFANSALHMQLFLWLTSSLQWLIFNLQFNSESRSCCLSSVSRTKAKLCEPRVRRSSCTAGVLPSARHWIFYFWWDSCLWSY